MVKVWAAIKLPFLHFVLKLGSDILHMNRFCVALEVITTCEWSEYIFFLTIYYDITKTRPCNIQRFFTAVKMTIFGLIFVTIFIFLLKTYIVGTQ